MTKLMIDLETLSTRNDAAILSIGVAVFDNEKILDSDGWAMSPKSIHGHIDIDTVFWWSKQDEASRGFSFTGKLTDASVAFNLKTFIAKHNPEEIWAKSPSFDSVILKSWWQRVSEKNVIGDFPLPYWAERDYRTLEAETIRAGYNKSMWQQFNFVAHNPIDDAVTQARAVIEMRRLIGGGRNVGC